MFQSVVLEYQFPVYPSHYLSHITSLNSRRGLTATPPCFCALLTYSRRSGHWGSFPFGNIPTFRPCSVSTSWQLVSVASAPAGNIISERGEKKHIWIQSSTPQWAQTPQLNTVHTNSMCSQGFSCSVIQWISSINLCWRWGCDYLCAVCILVSHAAWLVEKHCGSGFHRSCSERFVYLLLSFCLC